MNQVKIDTKLSGRKIIYNWNYPEWGGAQIYFLSIIKEARKDWDVKVILPEKSGGGFLKFLNELDVEYEFIDTFIDYSPAYTIFEKIKRQWKRISSEIKAYRHLAKYDLKKSILHIETAPWQSWILIWLLTRRGNVFVTMHNALQVNSEWRKLIWSKRLNFVLGLKNFHLFAANQNAIDSLTDLITAENRKKIVLTRAAINPEEIKEVLEAEFEKKDLLEKFKIPQDKCLILCVGQFIDRKGRWIYLEAARKVLESDKSVHFLWLTPVLPSDEEKQRINKYGLSDSLQIILSETVGKNRSEVLKFFKIADIFALPSLFEGLPIAILEAMALGLPVISTNITAIPEAVKQMETGLLIEPNNSDELAAAILKLKNDPVLRAKLAAAGRKFVLQNFDERKTAEITIANYEQSLTS